jgi:hypothetical protein
MARLLATKTARSVSHLREQVVLKRPDTMRELQNQQFVSRPVQQMPTVLREPSVVLLPVFVHHRPLRRVPVRQTTILVIMTVIQPSTVIVKQIRPPVRLCA